MEVESWVVMEVSMNGSSDLGGSHQSWQGCNVRGLGCTFTPLGQGTRGMSTSTSGIFDLFLRTFADDLHSSAVPDQFALDDQFTRQPALMLLLSAGLSDIGLVGRFVFHVAS